ncbi:putative ATP synthase subunit E, mitochondrial [Amylocarpus encephaloides]|uniref:ATP synthase F(0) complex subunit e, mitochondrial n=1 Tax=Amylocarpus encephaloides TaxID=45428 RepID=A0A9P8C5L8_9HELO|nr:putative ATP synthase subunit E, mitochondrial [Amylocarpus encephaloides]
MASTGVNVLRWSALGAGVLYGVYHQASLSTAAKLAAIDRKYQHKQHLIDQAKAEYAKSKLPASAKTSGGDVIRDPEDSKFDLEAYLNVVAAENK